MLKTLTISINLPDQFGSERDTYTILVFHSSVTDRMTSKRTVFTNR